MKISAAGLSELKEREGVVLHPYKDSAGLLSIGVGHCLTKSELRSGKLTALGLDWKTGISEEAAIELLQRDLAEAEFAVQLVLVPLKPYEYDALVSFAFNIGYHAFCNSTLLKLLNAGQRFQVPKQMERWIYSGGEIDPILVNRRLSEIRQWKGVE